MQKHMFNFALKMLKQNFNTRRNGIRNKNMLDADLLEF